MIEVDESNVHLLRVAIHSFQWQYFQFLSLSSGHRYILHYNLPLWYYVILTIWNMAFSLWIYWPFLNLFLGHHKCQFNYFCLSDCRQNILSHSMSVLDYLIWNYYLLFFKSWWPYFYFLSLKAIWYSMKCISAIAESAFLTYPPYRSLLVRYLFLFQINAKERIYDLIDLMLSFSWAFEIA